MPENTFQKVTDLPFDGPWIVTKRPSTTDPWEVHSVEANEGAAQVTAAELAGSGPWDVQICPPSGDRYTSL